LDYSFVKNLLVTESRDLRLLSMPSQNVNVNKDSQNDICKNDLTNASNACKIRIYYRKRLTFIVDDGIARRARYFSAVQRRRQRQQQRWLLTLAS